MGKNIDLVGKNLLMFVFDSDTKFKNSILTGEVGCNIFYTPTYECQLLKSQ